jgi:hypothetical protein
LAAHAVTSVPVESIGELRRRLVRLDGTPLPANFLKHADEQTYAGLAAVFQAIGEHSLLAQATSFRDWGVVGAPRFLGHAPMTSDLPRFLVEGAWDVSPHMIPHRTLHSLSGTVSQALTIHGPNFGAGGGPGAEGEGVLAAVALLEAMRLPGVWLVMTRLEPELDADHTTGKPRPGTLSQGLALALMPAGTPGIASLELTVGQSPCTSLTLASLADLLGQLRHHASVSQALGAGSRLTFRRRLIPPAATPFSPGSLKPSLTPRCGELS